MEQQKTNAAPAVEQSPRVVFVNDMPDEVKAQLANLFPEFEFTTAPTMHNRRSTDRVAEKPTIEKEKATAEKVLRRIADKQGLCFTNKEVEALTLLGDTFSPNFAAICAGIACLRHREQGWV